MGIKKWHVKLSENEKWKSGGVNELGLYSQQVRGRSGEEGGTGNNRGYNLSGRAKGRWVDAARQVARGRYESAKQQMQYFTS